VPLNRKAAAPRDCSKKPCKLCRAHARGQRSGHFIATADGFVCEDCFTPEELHTLGDEDVEVWEEGSHDWTGPVVCDRCKIQIPVYVDGGSTSEVDS
jgi:hypothetical protein